MRTLFLVGLLLAGIALAAVFSLRPASLGRAVERAETQPKPQRDPPAEQLTPVAAREEEAPVRATTPEPEPPPPPQGLEDGEKPVQPENDFAWKYGRSPREQLETALVELDTEVQGRIDELARVRFEEGRFVEQVLEPNDKRTVEQVVAALREPGQICEMRLVSEGRDVGTTGAKVLQIVELTRAEYPELYELSAERDWLRKALVPPPKQ